MQAVDQPENLPKHDTGWYETHPYTGYFDVVLTTRSPLYIRGPLTQGEFMLQATQDESELPFRQQVKNKPDFFFTRTPDQPVIPGSSLRGMLRSLLEIVSYGKVSRVTDVSLFFRSVDNSSLGHAYRRRMQDKVETGFLRRVGRKYVIDTCAMKRVPNHLIGSVLEGRGPNATPRWSGRYHQHSQVWVQTERYKVTAIDWRPQPGWEEGRLVISGPMMKKKKEFVFLLPSPDSESIDVPEAVIERFHDDDQVSGWQKKAFPQNKPRLGSRRRDGLLEDQPETPGSPIFFLREEGRIVFIGRAGMFRLPYEHSPIDFVPPELRTPSDIDFADALFGFVRTGNDLQSMDPKPKQGSPGRACAGRVSVTDARLVSAPEGLWLRDEPIVPRILATPKPTAFQHYLIQPSDEKRDLLHYASSPKRTAIRGHKLYWPQGERTIGQIEDREAPAHSTQHTQIRPVKSGVSFRFRVYFDNLSAQELGALCWVLQPQGAPDKEYVHRLGMGKPYGMGAVTLKASLHLQDNAVRYATLFDDAGWAEGERAVHDLSSTVVQREFIASFEEAIIQGLQRQGFSPDGRLRRLSDLRRIASLLKMMEWPGYPPDENGKCHLGSRPNTRYMRLKEGRNENEYKERPVLPEPLAFDPSVRGVELMPQRERIGSTGLQPRQGELPGRSLESSEPTRRDEPRHWPASPTAPQITAGAHRGTILLLKLPKGFGKITPAGGGDPIRFDVTGNEGVGKGDEVTYDLEQKNGEVRAVNVRAIR